MLFVEIFRLKLSLYELNKNVDVLEATITENQMHIMEIESNNDLPTDFKTKALNMLRKIKQQLLVEYLNSMNLICNIRSLLMTFTVFDLIRLENTNDK